MSAGRLLARRVWGVVLRGSGRVTVVQTSRCRHATFQQGLVFPFTGSGMGALWGKQEAGFASMSGKDTDHARVSNDEWESKLTPEQYNVTREKGTEPPFTGKYVNHSEKGVYTCVCCKAELFSSSDKFDSGSGWPSFTDVHKADGASNVIDRPDVSHGMVRTEVLCKQCDAHLGHVFEDGPAPTGLRYCINSASLGFNKK